MERERTSSLPLVQEEAEFTILHEYNCGQSVTTQMSGGTYYPVTGVSTMTDVVIEDFHARSKSGEIFINPMYKRVERYERVATTFDFDGELYNDNPCSDIHHFTGQKVYEGAHAFIPVPSGIPGHCDDLLQSALTSAFARNTTQKASALVTAGEGKETVTGVVDVIRRIMRIMYAVRKKQFKALKKELAPSEMADFWMEIRYGIRPIYFDMCQIVDAFRDATEIGSRLTTRGFRSYAYNDSDTVLVANGNYDQSIDRELQFQFTARAGCLSCVDRVGYSSLFGLTDIVSAIYDLATLSFVLDWFFNVGDTIAAHTPEANLTTLGAWTVGQTTVRQTALMTHLVDPKRVPEYTYTGTMYDEKPWTRTVTTTVRIPESRPSYLPRFQLNLNWAKLVDLCVIGRNIMKTLKSNDVRISRHGRLKKR